VTALTQHSWQQKQKTTPSPKRKKKKTTEEMKDGQFHAIDPVLTDLQTDVPSAADVVDENVAVVLVLKVRKFHEHCALKIGPMYEKNTKGVFTLSVVNVNVVVVLVLKVRKFHDCGLDLKIG
jgi:hypothetical protein